MTDREIPPGLVAEAKNTPGGWVYEIVGSYGPNDDVPPTAIRGAWKVDDNGNIEGNFIPNENFVAADERPRPASILTRAGLAPKPRRVR
ncbi:hypothetical protein [Kribbella sp. NPDC048928]|uniref:hypothetical protein n=1 Tax=Kribbella sp. NPDC048928 TaxID=3364111 RepID=UPI00371E5EAF